MLLMRLQASFTTKNAVYSFPRGKPDEGRRDRNSKEMVEYYERLTEEFPIVSLEDGNTNSSKMTGKDGRLLQRGWAKKSSLWDTSLFCYEY